MTEGKTGTQSVGKKPHTGGLVFKLVLLGKGEIQDKRRGTVIVCLFFLRDGRREGSGGREGGRGRKPDCERRTFNKERGFTKGGHVNFVRGKG